MEDRQAIERGLIAKREYLKTRIPTQGDIVVSVPLVEDLLEFQVTSLYFEIMPYDQGKGEIIGRWWVSGVWKFDGEKQDIPLEFYFLLFCPPLVYQKTASKFLRSLRCQNNIQGLSNFLYVLICIARPRLGTPHPAFGLWPDFEGEWESIEWVASMLQDYQKVSYFRYCYDTFPTLRATIIEAVKTMSMPDEKFAKYFIEACAEFWKAIYFGTDADGSEALKQLILSVTTGFEVYPCGNFEWLIIEKYSKLFGHDRVNYFAYVVKEGKQELIGMPNLEFTTEVPLEHERNRIPLFYRLERDKIKDTIAKCEVELEYLRTTISNHEFTEHRPDNLDEVQSFGASTPIAQFKSDAPTRTRICTKFMIDSEYREWIESLYLAGKLCKDGEDQIPWEVWYSAFSKPDGSPFALNESSPSREIHIRTTFESEIDFVRWIYPLSLEGVIYTKGKPGIPWKALTSIFVKQDGSHYNSKQLSVVLQKVKDES